MSKLLCIIPFQTFEMQLLLLCILLNLNRFDVITFNCLKISLMCNLKFLLVIGYIYVMKINCLAPLIEQQRDLQSLRCCFTTNQFRKYIFLFHGKLSWEVLFQINGNSQHLNNVEPFEATIFFYCKSLILYQYWILYKVVL